MGSSNVKKTLEFKNVSGKQEEMGKFIDLLFYYGDYVGSPYSQNDIERIHKDILFSEGYDGYTWDYEELEGDFDLIFLAEQPTEFFYLLNSLFGKTYVVNTIVQYSKIETFYDPCKCKCFHGGVDTFETEKSETDIEMREPSKEFIDETVAYAKKKNNTELLAVLSEKFEIA